MGIKDLLDLSSDNLWLFRITGFEDGEAGIPPRQIQTPQFRTAYFVGYYKGKESK